MNYLKTLLACGLLSMLCTASFGEEISDYWKFILKRPAKGWQQEQFDDSRWREGYGGFGTRGTPGARVGTKWETDDIWMRKAFELETVPAKPALLVHHDEDAEIFINGKPVANLKGYTTEFVVVPIAEEDRSALKTGKNILAVHCHQTGGGQFIDVHVVDSEHIPSLPPAHRSTKPFVSELITHWGAEVTPENAWMEYPRPQLRRKDWTNLNGHWDYAVTSISEHEKPAYWEGQILVPYCLESKLGGVQRLLDESEALWYHRSFQASKSPEKRLLLNFEAVDYRCEVFVNGQSVGKHTGGNIPFFFDISHAIVDGENELLVRVEDATEQFQLRGKQVLDAHGIWYTQVSGIWQTVWLEEVPALFAEKIKIETITNGEVTIHLTANGRISGQLDVIATVRLNGKEITHKKGSGNQLTLNIPNPQLWTPDTPTLYDLELHLNGDVVHSYFGIREVGKTKDAAGHWRFTLNGQPIFHWGPLDQGWWPDGLLTPPSDEGMLFDIEWLKSAGFNMIRKHIKVEPRRYYYHCDRVGMMVWQDQVSGGTGKFWPRWTRLDPNPTDAEWPEEQHEQFMRELDWMITSLESHPSIVTWVPFNEAWGQHKTIEVGRWTSERDPSRLVNIASGGNFWPAGDIVDEHRYPHPGFPFELGANGRFDNFIKVVGEFGGHGYPVPDHLWDAERRNWGYGGLPQNKEEYRERYETSLKMLNQLRSEGIAAGVYTQTTDVEGEINGLMTYDRKVIKIPAEELAQLHQILFEPLALNAGKQDADSFPRTAFVEEKTDRKPGPVMDAETIRSGLKSHDHALFIKSGWIRDPYITLGPDDYYYLTGTQPHEGDPREISNPYNIGLGDESIVGDQVRLWRSRDLIEWESLGPIFTVDDTVKAQQNKKLPNRYIWAPEVHWLGDRWALVHCPRGHSSLALTAGKELKGPWEHPMNNGMGERHDPSLFTDDDGTRYLLWGNTMIAPLSADLSSYTAEPVRIDPAGTRPGPDGTPINRIGHEGATMIKVGDKYVHLGTAWSTDEGRKGSYNLYYCVADQITGPYGPRQFAGRFLGHGTPFQDRDGNWWCTAFFNGNVPPLPSEGIENRDLGENAQTINEQGVTIVPLEVKLLDNGEVYIRAKDPAYGTPGPDEAQSFTAKPAFNNQPDIVVYLSDDHSQFDSSLYGNDNIPTPCFEELAADGMTFMHAFVASPSCAPSRAAMLTGLMPARNGAEANHTFPHTGTHSLISDLQAAGYEVAAFGKVAHGRSARQFGFDHIGPAQTIEQLKTRVTTFLSERESKKPLCLFVGTNNPHVAWTSPTTFDPAEVEFPPHHLDTPATREHRAAYYQEIRELDAFLGELREIADQHLSENMLFVHTSDHGSQWPFGKWNLYDYGIRVPLIISWQGHVTAGTRTDAMVSWIDLIPTLLELAGGTVPENLDGRSFAGVLRGETNEHREAIFTTHTGDGTWNIYPIRSVRTKDWKLIHNLHPEFAHTNHSDLDRKPMAGAYWTEWAQLAETDHHAQEVLQRYFERPEWELYHLTQDKWEQTNLANQPEQSARMEELKAMLADWMISQKDSLLVHSEPRRLKDRERWHPSSYKQTAP